MDLKKIILNIAGCNTVMATQEVADYSYSFDLQLKRTPDARITFYLKEDLSLNTVSITKMPEADNGHICISYNEKFRFINLKVYAGKKIYNNNIIDITGKRYNSICKEKKNSNDCLFSQLSENYKKRITACFKGNYIGTMNSTFNSNACALSYYSPEYKSAFPSLIETVTTLRGKTKPLFIDDNGNTFFTKEEADKHGEGNCYYYSIKDSGQGHITFTKNILYKKHTEVTIRAHKDYYIERVIESRLKDIEFHTPDISEKENKLYGTVILSEKKIIPEIKQSVAIVTNYTKSSYNVTLKVHNENREVEMFLKNSRFVSQIAKAKSMSLSQEWYCIVKYYHCPYSRKKGDKVVTYINITKIIPNYSVFDNSDPLVDFLRNTRPSGRGGLISGDGSIEWGMQF